MPKQLSMKELREELEPILRLGRDKGKLVQATIYRNSNGEYVIRNFNIPTNEYLAAKKVQNYVTQGYLVAEMYDPVQYNSYIPEEFYLERYRPMHENVRARVALWRKKINELAKISSKLDVEVQALEEIKQLQEKLYKERQKKEDV